MVTSSLAGIRRSALHKAARRLGVSVVVALLVACAGSPVEVVAPARAPVQAGSSQTPSVLRLPSPEVWGGQVRCTQTTGCRWVAVEHEVSAVVLYALEGHRQRLLDRRSVAYHPDGAAWIDDRHVVAAVEKSRSLDIFTVLEDGRLQPKVQIAVGFEPRDVIALPARDGGWLLLATPYQGEQVAWVHWRPDGDVRVVPQTWCATPWHMTVVPQGPQRQGPGLVTGCLDDQRVLYLPLPDTLDAATAAQPQVVRRFDHVVRRVGVTPSGRYWYVALELGGRVARYDVTNDAWQMLSFTPFGAVGVAPYDDDTVAWGENNRVLIVRYDAAGQVVAQRSFAVSGLPTQLQWIDVDGDGHRDLISMNSTGAASDILYGPLQP